MSERERYLEAFRTYYTLKSDYEKKNIKMRRKIYNDPSLSDRRNAKNWLNLNLSVLTAKT